MIVLWIILAIICALLIFMVVRTIVTKPRKVEKFPFEPLSVDADRVAKKLSDAVKVPTVTVLDDNTDENAYAAFDEYQRFLEMAFPLFHKAATKTLINGYSLVYVIKGSDESLLPGAFLAHQDVVPAPAEGWDVPPFSGEIKDGYVYGRGSQDMKGQMIALLESIELLLEKGFAPKRTIYCCFGHDEEYTGKNGAKSISKYLQENNIRFEFVVDEGGTVLDGSILGIKGMIALIGTCEKGYCDFELKATSQGGHSSSPKKRNAVDKMAEAVYDVSMSPMKSKFTKPVKEMFRDLAPNMKPLFKFFFVNRDILSPLLRKILTAVHPITNSLLRTTFAPTQAQGASAPNVLPPKATATINCRISVDETIEDVKKHLQKVVGKDIEVSILPGSAQPTPVSNSTSEAYKTLTRTINEVFEDFLPAPFPFIAATDAKYYYAVCDNVYRFTPFVVSEDDQTRIHALNERTEIKGLVKATQFFARLVENSCK